MKRRMLRAVPLALIVLALVATVWWDQSGQDRFRLARVGVAASDAGAPTTFADADGPGPLPNGLERIEGSLVVDLKDDASSTEIVDFEQRHEVDLKYNSNSSVASGLTVTEVSESRLPALLQELSQDPLVQHVEPNYLYYAQAFPDDPMFGQQWHMTQVRCLEAWPWSSGQNAVVAVLDTGVAYMNWQDFHQMEDLDKTRFVNGYDFVNKRVEALDDHCHGTHVAGTIAQSTNNGKGVVGLAWGCAIMPVKVLSKGGSGSVANIADAINFAADHGASVINMSLGGPFPSTVMDEACAYAKRHGTTVVCAAGNESKGRPGYPAAYAACVSVSATDRDENLTWYSNHGPDIDIAAISGRSTTPKTGCRTPAAIGNAMAL